MVCISFGFGLFNNVGSWVSCYVTLGCGLAGSLVLMIWWCAGFGCALLFGYSCFRGCVLVWFVG